LIYTLSLHDALPIFQVLAVVLAVTALEPLDDHVGVFDEALARLGHVEAERLELDARRATPDAEDQAPFREVVEERDLLGDAERRSEEHTSELQSLAY